MIKEIQYGGLTTVPSDYECADGDLAAVLNLVPEDGSLKPVQPPKTIMRLREGLDILYAHKTSDYTHYIVRNNSDNKLCWTTDGSTLTELYGLTETDLYQVTAIGNTLISLTSNGILYHLYSKGEYICLGTDMPELELGFYLVQKEYYWGYSGLNKTDSDFLYTFNLKYDTDFLSRTGGLNTTGVTALMAKMNKFVERFGTRKGQFTQPFFVRYAYRLYDGSLIKHSSPILMLCASRANPMLYFAKDDGTPQYAKYWQIGGCAFKLAYSYTKNDELEKWKDIIKSIDIFVSAPIYTYDQSIESGASDDDYSLDVEEFTDKSYYIASVYNETHKYAYYTSRSISTDSGSKQGKAFASFLFTQEEIEKNVKNVSNFYLLKSIAIGDLSGGVVNVEKDYLSSLIQKEVMTDDYRTNDKIIAKKAFVYNNRLNISEISRCLYSNFPFPRMVNKYTPLNSGKIKAYIYIKDRNKDIIVESNEYKIWKGLEYSPIYYFFYPNTNAYKIEVVVSGVTVNIGGLDFSDIKVVYTGAMTAHDFLNGAYFYNGKEGLFSQESVSYYDEKNNPITPSTPKERIISCDNQVYTSEIDNPFYFPTTGRITLGTGKVLDICAAVKALSQGQFGQFPLYAFTTEGVWALETSSTGTYTARQPVTRDVCINAGSITQLDSAVLFATDRGLMLIEGSQTTCLSDVLNGDNTLSIGLLPKMESVAKLAGFSVDDFTPIPFIDFIKDCRSVYDYTHQRIIVYNPSRTYAYVYSLKSKQWGMVQSAIARSLNSYPEALVQLHDGTLSDLSGDAGGDYKGVVITRPFKLDAPDVLKTISIVIQRGFFREGHVKCVLYASRDMFNWFIVRSSQDRFLRGFGGTPYKYFRLLLLCALKDDENLEGCSVRFVQRLTNRLR